MKQLPLLLGMFFPCFTILFAQSLQHHTMPDDSTIFHKLTVVDETSWAVDYGYGRIFKSTDEGASWRQQYETEGEFLEAIQFLDKNTGFICGDYGLIMKTVDGGATWSEIGPSYYPRITRSNAMEGDSNAIMRYYYQMHFKDKEHGLVWGFEIKPTMGWKSRNSFFYETQDAGHSWERIEYNRSEFDGVVDSYLANAAWNEASVLGIYRRGAKEHKTGRRSILQRKSGDQDWQAYPLPQLPDDRFMLRTIHYISDHQGYVLGGSLAAESQGYILETLDGGQSWRQTENDLPHIHYSTQKGRQILMTGKSGLLQHWTPKAKADSSFIHRGDASRILIDGKIGRGEWVGASRTIVQEGIDLYALQDEHYLYLSVQYDTSRFSNYYCDLYFDLGNDTLLNLHASQQLGERLLTGDDWTDSEQPFDWGYISNWTANAVSFDRIRKQYLPYRALEFQISKSKLPTSRLAIRLQTRDMNWEHDPVNFPEDGDFKNSSIWKVFYIPKP
ncbi:MAG: hypothetical protein KTR24_08125 [Saprospiraceae bacterium]|nr:hypothetical protein [Saprospiraceae bacterium]